MMIFHSYVSLPEGMRHVGIFPYIFPSIVPVGWVVQIHFSPPATSKVGFAEIPGTALPRDDLATALRNSLRNPDSMDWLKGKSTPETIDFPMKYIWGFPVLKFSRENQSIDRCVMVELPGLVNVYITYITMERSTIGTMGKSTISSGPFSIANCEIARM